VLVHRDRVRERLRRCGPDALVNLEAPFGIPGSGPYQIEQSFVIVASGAEPLTARARNHVVPAASTASP
jgi:hypothetical protein